MAEEEWQAILSTISACQTFGAKSGVRIVLTAGTPSVRAYRRLTPQDSNKGGKYVYWTEINAAKCR
jgi:hypothetical protein